MQYNGSRFQNIDKPPALFKGGFSLLNTIETITHSFIA